MESFETKVEVRWSDVDANRHVRHSAYYDYGAHARIRFFEEKGIGSFFMSKLNIGPVLFKEECHFIKELNIQDNITINILKGTLSSDGARWELHHEIFNSKGEKSAHITTKGAWLDLKTRKLSIPPVEIVKAFQHLPEGEEYIHKKSK